MSSVGDLLRNRAFLTTIYLNFAYLWIIGGVFDTLVPLFGEDKLGLSPGGIGVIFAIVLAAELAVLYPAGSAADRFGRRFVAVPATAGLAVGAALLGLAGSPLAYGLLMIPLGLASGFAGVPPGAMLSDIAPGQRSGTAVGIFRFTGDLGITLGPLAAGLATSYLGFGPAFMLCAIPVAFGAVLVALTPETLASRHLGSASRSRPSG
jgi:MFS family permease